MKIKLPAHVLERLAKAARIARSRKGKTIHELLAASPQAPWEMINALKEIEDKESLPLESQDGNPCGETARTSAGNRLCDEERLDHERFSARYGFVDHAESIHCLIRNLANVGEVKCQTLSTNISYFSRKYRAY